MVLEREDDRILGGLESTLGDGLDYILRHSKRTRALVFSSDTHSSEACGRAASGTTKSVTPT